VALLITIVMRVRVLAAREAGVALEQRSWGPAVGFGVVTGAFGVPWAPLPVARTDRPATAVHWLGPVLLAGTALVLLLLAAWLRVPVTREVGGAALVMAASMLVPIDPLDRAAVAKGTGTAVTLAVLGTGTLLLVGLI
jgi:cellulose synthase operon protein C